MKTFNGIAGMLILLVLSSCSSSRSSVSSATAVWQDKKVIIDGKDDEYPSLYPRYDSKARISFIVSNDDQNIYISVKSNDDITIGKIIHSGMQIWIDPSGKKHKQWAINFPLKNSPRLINNESSDLPKNGEHRQEPGQMRKQAIAAIQQFSLTGFEGCEGIFLTGKGTPCNIDVAMSLNNDNELVYEAAIPLQLLYQRTSAKVQKLSVCFEVNSSGMPAGNDRPQRPGDGRGGMPPGGGGMPPGGGMSPGGGGMPPRNGSFQGDGPQDDVQDMQQRFEGTETWFKTQLATK